MSRQSELKENILASKLEGALTWGIQNRTSVITGLGILLGLLLLSSVIIISRKQTLETNLTRLAQAQALVAGRQFDKAEQILTDISNQRPSGNLALQVHYYHGIAALGLKKYDDAIALFQKVVDEAGNSPLKPLALVNLGFTYEEKKEFSQAADIYGRFIVDFSDHFLAPRTQLSLGRALALAGKKDESKKAFDQLIDLYPTSEWAKIARSFIDKNKTR
jgi:TolA-binding protein